MSGKRTGFLKRALGWLEFVAFYLCEVVASNFRVAWDVLTPAHRMRPAMVEIEITGLTQRQLLALANLVTMTPGTLSVDLNEAGDRLLIHSMYTDDPGRFARRLQDNYVRRIRDVF